MTALRPTPDPVAPAACDCPVCAGTPRVLVAIRHAAMREYTRELLRRELNCWVATEMEQGEMLRDAIRRHHPDVIVVDSGDFPDCCRTALERFPRDRVIVIGPEPDPRYRTVALANGAGSWLPRDRVGDDLIGELRAVLGCAHRSRPESGSPDLSGTAAGSTGGGGEDHRP